MKKILSALTISVFITTQLIAQAAPTAGTWKTWFIPSAKAYRLAAPASGKSEIAQVMAMQQALDSAGKKNIVYWNAGAPGYRWLDVIGKLWMNDTSNNGAFANMLLNTAIYDATIAAWDTKYAYNRQRPFAADSRIKTYVQKPESPSYPCEHSVTAGVASAIIAHFYPLMADSVNRMAVQQMNTRIAAGVAFPSDTRAGFELGKRIAEIEIEKTKDYVTKKVWDGKRPAGPQIWQGVPMLPMAGYNKTVVLKSSSQFRPLPPPDFAKEMAALKAYKPTFRGLSNAFFWAGQSFWEEELNKRIFEYNLHLNPPEAARIYAIKAVGTYDGFVSCWDAKYAYWGTRPDQYDTSYHPVILHTPPFPGYPSGHAAISAVMGELYSYLFPAEAAFFRRKAQEAADSRFQAGIHFKIDNEVGLELGKKIADMIIAKIKTEETCK